MCMYDILLSYIALAHIKICISVLLLISRAAGVNPKPRVEADLVSSGTTSRGLTLPSFQLLYKFHTLFNVTVLEHIKGESSDAVYVVGVVSAVEGNSHKPRDN